MSAWKEQLAGRIAPEMARDLDAFEAELELARRAPVDPAVFTEMLRRRGVYGQRYDHGTRNDGEESRPLGFGERQKGKGILWDAPGMQRIKVPLGALTPEQMETIADLAEEYADSIAHVTTRQDIQLHYVHLDDTVELMRRLAAVGVTTQEACGNTVRNVTACPLAGVCRDEAFDVSPHARAVSRLLLGHPDAQDFGRKFKLSFSGCSQHACALARMHDIGVVAAVQGVNGSTRRGFTLWVGGGLGAVPHQAKLLHEFIPEAELLPTVLAVVRVFTRHGDKSARHKARMKFLVAKLGIEEFKRLVEAERASLPLDPRWTAHLHSPTEASAATPAPVTASSGACSEFAAWKATNVSAQKQPGYAAVAITLPLGDIAAWQLRGLAQIARRFSDGDVRLTVEQNAILRFVCDENLTALYRELCALGLGQPGAGTIADVTACPGTDTCRLGISSSRGLAAELRARLLAAGMQRDEALGDLRIKISGCFNSCGQHHVADLGFYGSSRAQDGHVAPHFMVVLGGQWGGNAAAFGLPIGSIPAKNIPEVVERITSRYAAERRPGERFQQYLERLGKKAVKALLEDLKTLPSFEAQPGYYVDWGDARKFSLADMMNTEGPGPPAVRAAQLELAHADRIVFEAQLALEQELDPLNKGVGRQRRPGGLGRVAELAYAAMKRAASALVLADDPDAARDGDGVEAFRARFVETGRFNGASGEGRFAHYLLAREKEPSHTCDGDAALEELHKAQLFIEAAHACYGRMTAK